MTASERRRSWARALMGRCEGLSPAYGSPEWLALPEGPAKVAAVVRAAECWAMDGDEMEARLRAEVEALRHAFQVAEDAEFVARGEAHRASWTGRGFRPDPDLSAEVEREWLEWAGGEVS